MTSICGTSATNELRPRSEKCIDESSQTDPGPSARGAKTDSGDCSSEFVSTDVSIPDRQATLLSRIVKRECPDHVRAAKVTEVYKSVQFVIERRRVH